MINQRKRELMMKMIADPKVSPRAKKALRTFLADANDPPGVFEDMPSGDDPTNLLKCHYDENDEENAKKEQQAIEMFDGIQAFIEDNNWHPRIVAPKRKAVLLGFSMRRTALKVLVHVDAEAESICMQTTLPITCPKEYRMLLGSTLNQLNESFRYGAFRLDADTGAVTYRFSYFISGQAFNAKIFSKYLRCCLAVPDINYKLIAGIAAGSMSQEEKATILENLQMLTDAIKH